MVTTGMRRTLPTLCLVILVLAAGCTGGGSPPSGGASSPETNDDRADCAADQAVPHFEPPDEPLPQQVGGLRLSVSERSVARGDGVTFEFRNVADERRYTGTRATYLLQRRDGRGWETVTLLRDSHLGFNATAVAHAPGEGFEWSFAASAEGFTEGKFVVCERLRPDEYRFVYATDPPVAVRFEITE